MKRKSVIKCPSQSQSTRPSKRIRPVQPSSKIARTSRILGWCRADGASVCTSMALPLASAPATVHILKARQLSCSSTAPGQKRTSWNTAESLMIWPRSTPPRSRQRRNTKRITKASRTAAKLAVEPRRLRFRKGQPRLHANQTSPSAQTAVLKHRGKALTLRQWAQRGQAGLTPSQIWRLILMGFPLDEALGGRNAVARAIAFVGSKEARSIRRKDRLLRKRRRIAARRVRGNTRCHSR